MKKIISLFFSLFVLLSCSFSASAYENESFYKTEGQQVINVFNWGEYISDSYEDGLIDVNKEFEAYGHKGKLFYL